MPRTTRIKVRDQEYDAIDLDFQIAREEWNEYTLLDGGRVRMKTSPQRMYRVLDADGKPANNEQGEPFIIVRHNTTIVSIE